MKPFIYTSTVDGELINVLSILSEDFVFKNGLNHNAVVGYFKENFIENLSFKSFFNKIISKEILNSENFLIEGSKINNGYVYIFDDRTMDTNNVPSCDIIGAYKFENSIPIEDSYQENNYYKLYTENGLFKLEPRLEQIILEKTMLLISH